LQDIISVRDKGISRKFGEARQPLNSFIKGSVAPISSQVKQQQIFAK
jgi:hypothetical protein